MSNTMWKNFEREIALWFNTRRNPLSGKNNCSDSGEARSGDIVVKPEWSCLIECKTRKTFPKSGTYYRALETIKEAKERCINNWFHFERKNGSKEIYILATNREWMERICAFLKDELESESKNDTTA